jgi:hypothetical protein
LATDSGTVTAPNNDTLEHEVALRVGPVLQEVLEQLNKEPKQINCPPRTQKGHKYLPRIIQKGCKHLQSPTDDQKKLRGKEVS